MTRCVIGCNFRVGKMVNGMQKEAVTGREWNFWYRCSFLRFIISVALLSGVKSSSFYVNKQNYEKFRCFMIQQKNN